MKLTTVCKEGKTVAVITGEELLLIDAQSALDLMMTARYETGSSLLALDKRVVAEDFFILSCGLAGEVLQKFINYQMKVAIFGDYSKYTSKPLRDFIYESNKGKAVFFAAGQEEAVERLVHAEN